MAHYSTLTWHGDLTARTRRERQPCAYRPYHPDPLLGREVLVPGDLVADLADAERAVGALQTAARDLGDIESLTRVLLRAEAVGSSYIEGLRVGPRRLARAAFAASVGLDPSDDTARAVLGNIDTLHCALELARTADAITLQDLCDLHARLLAGTRDAAWGGVLRTEQNWIGGITPCSAAYVPPPHPEVRPLLEDLCSYLSRTDHPALMQAALAHAQFETIHPFVDGNGRLGRALIHLVLRRRGLAGDAMPPFSLALAQRADTYINGLIAFRHETPADHPEAHAAAVAWISLFTAEMLRACEETDAFTQAIFALTTQWRAAVGKVRAGSALDALIGVLPGLPVLTVDTAAALIGRSQPRTNAAVARLVEAGVITQTTLGRRNRVFEVTGLIDALTHLERHLTG